VGGLNGIPEGHEVLSNQPAELAVIVNDQNSRAARFGNAVWKSSIQGRIDISTRLSKEPPAGPTFYTPLTIFGELSHIVLTTAVSIHAYEREFYEKNDSFTVLDGNRV
jgi:hypothetical protein